MNTSNTLFLLYLVVSLVAMGVMAYYLVKCHNKSDFCMCSGMDNKYCPDPNELKRLYAEGKLTEYSQNF